MRYDGAGNLTQDLCHNNTTPCTRTYDAEGRLVAAQYLNGQVQTACYTYDAEGQRVVRSGGWEGQVRQVYGFDGELLAEYTPQAAASAPRKEYGYRSGELLITAESPEAAERAKLARSAAGASATASSILDANRPAAGAIDGDRAGHNWGAGGGWHDSTNNSYPDWLEVNFGEEKTIDEVGVFSVQDTYWSPQEPAEASAFAQYRLVDFNVQYWTGSAWAAMLGCQVRGNSLVWRKLKFSPVTTTKVRLLVHAAQAGYSRVAEVEAYGGAAEADLRWLVTEQFGPPRMIFDRTGSLAGVERQDYFPFGEEVGTGVAGRTPQRGYGPGSVRQKFTGYERDGETGLDYAQARYYANGQGYFPTTNPLFLQEGMLVDPQRFNLYAYLRNNPLAFVDPSGEKIDLSANEEARQKQVGALRIALIEVYSGDRVAGLARRCDAVVVSPAVDAPTRARKPGVISVSAGR